MTKKVSNVELDRIKLAKNLEVVVSYNPRKGCLVSEIINNTNHLRIWVIFPSLNAPVEIINNHCEMLSNSQGVLEFLGLCKEFNHWTDTTRQFATIPVTSEEAWMYNNILSARKHMFLMKKYEAIISISTDSSESIEKLNRKIASHKSELEAIKIDHMDILGGIEL